jgi:hypothetical protein
MTSARRHFTIDFSERPPPRRTIWVISRPSWSVSRRTRNGADMGPDQNRPEPSSGGHDPTNVHGHSTSQLGRAPAQGRGSLPEGVEAAFDLLDLRVLSGSYGRFQRCRFGFELGASTPSSLHRCASTLGVVDRSSTKLVGVLPGRPMTHSLLGARRPRNEHCIKPGGLRC